MQESYQRCDVTVSKYKNKKTIIQKMQCVEAVSTKLLGLKQRERLQEQLQREQ